MNKCKHHQGSVLYMLKESSPEDTIPSLVIFWRSFKDDSLLVAMLLNSHRG